MEERLPGSRCGHRVTWPLPEPRRVVDNEFPYLSFPPSHCQEQCFSLAIPKGVQGMQSLEVILLRHRKQGREEQIMDLWWADQPRVPHTLELEQRLFPILNPTALRLTSSFQFSTNIWALSINIRCFGMKLTRRGSLRNSNLMGNPWTFGICLALGCAEDCTFQIAGAEMCSEMSSLGMWVLCQAPFRTRTLVQILWQTWQYHNGFCKNHLWIGWCGSLFPALVSLPSFLKFFLGELHRVLV